MWTVPPFSYLFNGNFSSDVGACRVVSVDTQFFISVDPTVTYDRPYVAGFIIENGEDSAAGSIVYNSYVSLTKNFQGLDQFLDPRY